MKWIGQHIWDFISRFRNDVYFESVPDGTIASGKNLGLDSNNKLVKESDTGITDLHGAGVDGSANQLLTDDGDGTVTSEANLTFDGETITVSSDTTYKPELTLKSTTNDNKGSTFRFVSDKGAAGADGDVIGSINFTGDNSVQEQTDFCRIDGKVNTALDTNEVGDMLLRVATSNGTVSSLAIGAKLTGHASNNIVDVNLGSGTASTTTIEGKLTMGSTIFANSGGVIQVATQGNIDHDSLANYVANEHIDWTNSSAGTIHSSNIPTLNQDTTGNADTATNLTAGDKTLAGIITMKGLIADGDRSVTAGGDGVALHIDAMDITNSSTSASGTTGFYNHVTFENPRLLATNSNVTTTNASTLYVKGAPVASTNQTITNAYSIFVQGGNSYFGGDIIGDGSTTISGIDTITATGIITGKQRQIYQQSFIDDLGANNKHYLPWRDTDEQTTIYQEEAAMVAPYDGRIVSVTMRISSVSGTGTRTIGIHTLGPNTSQFSTSSWTEEETEDASISSTDDNHLFYFVFDNAKHFESGELVTLSIIDDTDLTSGQRYTYISTVVEWDYNNGLGTGTSSAEFDSAP